MMFVNYKTHFALRILISIFINKYNCRTAVICLYLCEQIYMELIYFIQA